MGFFSYNCKCCGKSIVNSSAICPVTEWQSEFILFTNSGDVKSGRKYRGYGFHDDDDLYENFTVYHKACWEHAGRPEYQGQSEGARDQGYFFEDKDHDFAPPGTQNPDEWVRVRKIERLKLREQQWLQEAIWDLESIWYDSVIYDSKPYR